MKYFYTLALAFFASFAALSQTNQVVVNEGSWSSPGTWSLGHTPLDGETIVVPAGTTLLIDENIVTSNNYVINVYGNLLFKVGKLNVGSGTIINISAGATITTKQGNPSDRITIGGVTKYSGSEGNITGPLVLTGTPEPIILPVKFIAYSVARVDNGVAVKWTTSEEKNAHSYVIERSEDGANWKPIATVFAAGNSSDINNYSFTDKAAFSSVVYYRVKQVDIDGIFVYTTIKSIRNDSVANSDMKVTSNASSVVVEMTKQLKGNVVVRIVSLSGQVVAQQAYNQPAGHIMLNKPSLSGNYIVSISNGHDIKLAKQIML
jgi:hypothetical protein